MPRRLTQEQFEEKGHLIHNHKYDYSLVKYTKNSVPVPIICREKYKFGVEHGIFEQTPRDHLTGRGCFRCNPAHKKDTVEWIRCARIIWLDAYDYSRAIYVGGKKKLTIICNARDRFDIEHGPFEQEATSHLLKNGCPKCGFERTANSKRHDTEYFRDKSNLVHEGRYDYSKSNYTRRDEVLVITCSEHGDFEQMPSNHWQGKGCPKCSLSRGEFAVQKALDHLGIKYITQARFDTCKYFCKLPFDTYLPDLNAIIEFDGKQHFELVDHWEAGQSLEDRTRNDIIKDRWCIENKKYLLRLSYKDLELVQEHIEVFLEILPELGEKRIIATRFYEYLGRDYSYI